MQTTTPDQAGTTPEFFAGSGLAYRSRAEPAPMIPQLEVVGIAVGGRRQPTEQRLRTKERSPFHVSS